MIQIFFLNCNLLLQTVFSIQGEEKMGGGGEIEFSRLFFI